MMTMVFKMFTLGLSWSQSNTECQAFCPVVRLGSPPCKLRPLQANVSPPLNPKGESNTRLRVRGWGYPVRTTGQKAWHSVYSVVLMFGLARQRRLSLQEGVRRFWPGWGRSHFNCGMFTNFILNSRNFYFLSDKILTVLFLRSCSMPSEERKFYCTFA